MLVSNAVTADVSVCLLDTVNVNMSQALVRVMSLCLQDTQRTPKVYHCSRYRQTMSAYAQDILAASRLKLHFRNID